MNYENTNSTFYQLTPDILMEYIHFDVTSDNYGELVELGYVKPNFVGNYADISKESLQLYTNTETGTKYLIKQTDKLDETTNNCSLNSSVTVDTSEAKYVKLKEDQLLTEYEVKNINIEQSTDNNQFLVYDIIILHLTNGNYMSYYDGFIISNSIQDNLNNKIYLSSIEFKKTDNPELEDSPLLIAEKLYTTKFQFRIPSIKDLSKNEQLLDKLVGNVGLLENTALNVSLKGIRKTYTDVTDNTIYETEELTNIKVPYVDKFKEINVAIEEASDGDYFNITAKTTDQSLSDYLISHGLNNVTIMHDLTVTETYYDVKANYTKNELTRREYFIVGVNDGQDDSVDDTITFRPILMKENIVSFTIQDTLRIYNNVDQTTIVKTGSLTYGLGENQSVRKYGKYIERIADPGVFQVKVFNKRKDVNDTVVKLVNTTSSGFNAPDRVAVTKFIDAKNIAISVQQVQLTE